MLRKQTGGGKERGMGWKRRNGVSEYGKKNICYTWNYLDKSQFMYNESIAIKI